VIKIDHSPLDATSVDSSTFPETTTFPSGRSVRICIDLLSVEAQATEALVKNLSTHHLLCSDVFKPVWQDDVFVTSNRAC
jgi:hypothetical protein